MKFRIVKKQKDGVLISPAKGAEPIKMGWKEFDEGYMVEDKVWAIPTKKTKELFEKINDLTNKAVRAFFMSGSNTDEITNLAYLATLGDTITKIQEMTGWTNIEIINLIKVKIDAVKNISKNDVKSGYRKKNFNQKKNEPKGVEFSTSAVFADNPELMKLKEKFSQSNN